MNLLKVSKTITHMLLTVVIILFITTGFGITNYQIVESLTLGGLSKPLSFQIHTNLTIPLILLLIAHIGFTIGKKFWKKKQP